MDNLLNCHLDSLSVLLVLQVCRYCEHNTRYHSCIIARHFIASWVRSLYKITYCFNLFSISIYNVRKLLVYWYEQRQKKEEGVLAKLRKEQRDKLEDLKNKTSYYKTQSLLEKYDDDILKKKKEQERLLQQQQQQKKPVSLPVRPTNQRQPQPFPPSQNPQQRQLPPQQQQPVFPQPRSEPQWYDKIVDALVGETGPETKYALICNHCFSHNGLVLKEEYDTIRKYTIYI